MQISSDSALLGHINHLWASLYKSAKTDLGYLKPSRRSYITNNLWRDRFCFLLLDWIYLCTFLSTCTSLMWILNIMNISIKMWFELFQKSSCNATSRFQITTKAGLNFCIHYVVKRVVGWFFFWWSNCFLLHL